MSARELLVKLGFDIDEGKFNRFVQNVDVLKAKLSTIQSKIGLNVDNEKLNRFKQQVDEVKTKISDVKGQFGINVDDEKLKNAGHTIASVKAQMIELRKQINQHMYPEINLQDLAAYKKELATMTKEQRQEVLALNKVEKDATNDQIRLLRGKYTELQIINNKLGETGRKFKEALRTAKSANATFSRFFTKFAIVGAGSALLSIRKTLKDAEDFKAGGAKTNNHFSREQLNSVHRFNVSLKQLSKTTGELRNRFVIGLLPAFKTNLDLFNAWIGTNKKMIDSKIQKFIDTLTTTLKILASAISMVFSVLNPLANLIGGWGVVLSGVIGLGILSWLIRLGAFLGAGATAVTVFATAIKALGAALVTNPIALLIMAIVAALVLIADEFIVTANGGDSLINRFGGLKKIGESFIETLKEMWQWLVKVGDNMIDFGASGIDKVKDFFGAGDKRNQAQTPHASFVKSIVPSARNYSKNDIDTKQEMANRFGFPASSSRNYYNTQAENNNTKTFNVTNNMGGMVINVPKGTTEDQSKYIAREVQNQLEFRDQKMLNIIGAV